MRERAGIHKRKEKLRARTRNKEAGKDKAAEKESFRDKFIREQRSRDKSCVETTIQGWPVTIIKCSLKYRTQTDFTFHTRPPGISEAQFLASYGSQNSDFVFGLIHQLANVSPRIRQLSAYCYGEVDDQFCDEADEDEAPDVEALKSWLASLRALAPRDPFEAMTCAQMTIVHSLSMVFANVLGRSFAYPDIESRALSSTKLLRIYSALAGTLERHRSVDVRKLGGQQSTLAVTISNGTAPKKPDTQSYLRYESNGRHGKVYGAIGPGPGLQDPDFVSSLFGPLTKMGTLVGFSLDSSLTFACAFVTEMAPLDAHEALICAQLATAHLAAMFFAKRLTHIDDDSLDMASAGRGLNMYLRAFCNSAEAFDRHRMRTAPKISARTAVANALAVVGDIHQNGSNTLGSHHNGAKMPGQVNGHTSA